ncbi:hypothetical protein O3M35_010145 [Rhynocoris fuscipes]|uniref:Uncharacterized protein n=1 Tax=Rhynocoris fuscipes TaxID=488301 RepID=A0AAW1D5K2_9HEMI
MSEMLSYFISLLGTCLGVAGLIVFPVLGNISAAIWAGLSAFYAFVIIYCLLYKEYHDYLFEDFDGKYESHFLTINCFAVCSTIILSGIQTWYIFKIFYYKLPLLPFIGSYALIALFCLITTIWAIFIAYISQKEAVRFRYSPIN